MFIPLRVLIVLLLLGLGMPRAFADATPGAFITVIDLRGADLAAGTAVRRGGEELQPRLLMPLFAGDEVFLRDAQSRIVLESETGAETEVAGAGARFEVKGEGAASGGFWSMLGAVADAVSGQDGEVAPDNMMSRDTEDAITVPMAVRGGNHVVTDGKPLWLAWRGGKAPYRLSIAAGESVTVNDNITAREISFEVPDPAPRRIKVTIEDAGGRRATILLKTGGKRPEPPFAAPRGSSGSAAQHLAYAAWLTSIDEGSWSVEAARLLAREADGNPAAALLLRRIADGWKAGADEPAGN